MIENLGTNKYVQNLALGLLGTATAFGIVGMPQEAQAAGLSYGYAYQQITNLKAVTTGPAFPTLSFGSNTSALATVNPGGSSSQSNPFDTAEAYVGPGAGLGNNSGFFPPLGDSNFTADKGKVNPNYARADAQTVATSSSDIYNQIFGSGTGLALANVAESYVTTAIGPTGNPNFLVTQGNGIGRNVLTSEPFSVSGNTNIYFTYDFRNELYAELGQNTPLGAPIGNQASSEVKFQIQIAEVSGSTVTPVYLFNPVDTNFLNAIAVQGVADAGVFEGSVDSRTPDGEGQSTFTFLPNKNYQIQFIGEEIVDTRLVEQKQQEVPEPTSLISILGIGALGLGLKRKKQQV